MNSVDLSARARLVAGVRVESTHVDTLQLQQQHRTAGLHGGRQLHWTCCRARRCKFADDAEHGVAAGLQPRAVASRSAGHRAGGRARQRHAEAADRQPRQSGPEAGARQQLRHPARAVSVAARADPGRLLLQGADRIRSSRRRRGRRPGPFAGFLVSQPGNAGSATLQGFEVAYQQHLGFLPGALAGLGLSANYGYTTSEARGLPLRTDHPALLRQAPHTWNISPTYDRGPLSLRVGMSYNGANIYAYQYQNLNSDGTPMAAERPDGRRHSRTRRRQLSLRALPARRAGDRPRRRRASRWWCTV